MTKISKEINIHTFQDLRLKAYWALDSLATSQKDRFTSSEIAGFLVNKIGVSTSRQAIEHLLKNSSGDCNKNKQGYKLMQQGKDKLLESLNKNKVTFINANQPFSAKNITLKEILGGLHKEVYMCDPYLDLNTLDVIYRVFEKDMTIKLLTCKINDKPSGSFKRQLEELLTEGFQIEIRIYKHELHDRYILDEKNFWFSGNSFNHLGKKESLIILLGQDFQQSMLATFNSHWIDSVTL